MPINQDSKTKEEKFRDVQIDQVNNQLGLTYLTRKTEIYFLPTDIKKTNLLSYRRTVLKEWNTPTHGLNMNEQILERYDWHDYWPIRQRLADDKYSWLSDEQPLVTYLDVKRCCDEVGLDPSIYYEHCQQYRQKMEADGINQTGVIKLFDTNYPDQLYSMVKQWISNAKVDTPNMSKNNFSKLYIDSIKPVIEHLNKECQHRYYQYLLATANPEDPIDEPESCFENDNYWRQTRWGFDQPLVADGNDSIANALSQNEIRLYDGQIRDNPLIITTNLVHILCTEHQIEYQKFENYRNQYNQILARYGDNSKEFKSIDWNENHLII